MALAGFFAQESKIDPDPPCAFSVKHYVISVEASTDSVLLELWLIEWCVRDEYEYECSNRTMRCTFYSRSEMSALGKGVLPK